MVDSSSSQETTAESTQRTIDRNARRGEKSPPKVTNMAAAVRRIEAGLAEIEATGVKLSLQEQRTKTLIGLHEGIAEEQGDVDLDTLTLQQKIALLDGIGYSVGQQLFAGIVRGSRIAGGKIVEGAPMTGPLTVAGSAATHEFAVRFPEVAATIAASDEATLIAAGVAYLGYKSIKGLIQEGNLIDPIITEFRKRVQSFRENPARKGTQAAMFAAACAGAVVALADPEGAGRTITPVLGGVATLEFTHRLTEKLNDDIGAEVVTRMVNGQAVDINDPSFLLSMGITELKKFTSNFIGKVRDSNTIRKLVRSLGQRGYTREVLPHGTMEEVLEELILRNGHGHSERERVIPSPRGSNTARHPTQHHDTH